MSSYKSLVFQIYALIHETRKACMKNVFIKKFGYTEIHKTAHVPTNENELHMSPFILKPEVIQIIRLLKNGA